MSLRATRSKTLAPGANEGLQKMTKDASNKTNKVCVGSEKNKRKRKTAAGEGADDDKLNQTIPTKKLKKANTYLDPFANQDIIPEPQLSVAQHEAHSQNLVQFPMPVSSESSPSNIDDRSPFQESLDSLAPIPEEPTDELTEQVPSPAPSEHDTKKAPTLAAPRPTQKPARKPLIMPPLTSIKPKSSSSVSSKPSLPSLRQESLAPSRASAPPQTSLAPSHLSVPPASAVPQYSTLLTSVPNIQKQSAPTVKTSRHVTDLIAGLVSHVDRLENELRTLKESEQRA